MSHPAAAMPTPPSLLAAISAYLPFSVLRRVLADPAGETHWQERSLAAVLLADVSGFTAMSEALAAVGKEGAEELTSILNAYFTAMINLVNAFGGDVIKFGGDAITCQFPAPGGDLPQAVARACACAQAMQARMADFGAVQTRFGTFQLRMKIGLSAGPVLAVSVGEPRQGLSFVLAGRPLDEMALAEQHAAAGEIWVWGGCLDDAGVSWEKMGIAFRAEQQGFCLLETAPCPPQGAEPLPDWGRLDEATARQIERHLVLYLPPTVYEQIRQGQPQFVGEHRCVASLFVGFSGLDYDDDPQAGDKLQEYFAAMQAIIHRYGGRLNWISTGDKGSLLHLLFGAPVSHEDNEARAVGCALEMRQAVSGLPFITAQRIGVASGAVFAGDVGSETQRGYTVMGDVVNLSARLMQAAAAGEILLDEHTTRRVEGQFACDGPTLIHVKGKSHPVAVWRAVGRRRENKTLGNSASARHATPLVGRQQEQQKIQAILARARAGEGQLLVICGEAGVGKSRLVEELVAQARQQPLLALEGDCYAYGVQSPYLPWIGLLQGLFGFDAETDAGRLERIEQALSTAAPELREWTPLIGQLMGLPVEDNPLTAALDAQLRKQRLFDIILALLKDRARQTPLLLLIFEDVHWADTISIELLNYVARNIGDQPILLTAVHRPSIELSEWPRYPYYNQFSLTDLCAEDALTLTRLKLGMTVVPEALQHLILRGESHINTFYLEEMLNALIDWGYLAPAPSGQGYQVVGDLSQVELPASIQALVMSRIDQLDESSKLTVKVASVIGRTFLYRTLAAIYPVEIASEKLQANLERLSRLDLTPLDRPAPDWEYIFKHVITQEVAYESLLYAHRRALHHRLAQYLEQTHAAHLAEVYDLLAHHYYHSADVAKSWRYLLLAGNQARSRYANEAAIASYRLALSLHVEGESRSPVYEALGDVYQLTGQYDAALQSYQQALSVEPLPASCQATVWRKMAKTWELQGQYDQALHDLERARQTLLGDAQPDEAARCLEMARIFEKMGWIAMQRGEYDEARQFCQEGLRLLGAFPQQAQSQEISANLHNGLGTTCFRRGDYEQAISHYNTCVEIRERCGDLYGLSAVYNNLAAVYWGQSAFDQVKSYLSKSLEISRKIGDPYGTAMCYNNLGAVFYAESDYARAVEFYQKSLEIRLRIGDLQGIADVYNNLGEVYRTLGDHQQALHYLRQAVALFIELGDKMTLIDAYKLIAEVALDLGKLDEAFDDCQRALQLARELGNREYEGVVCRVQATIAQAIGESGQAGQHFQRSVEILRAAGNRLELAKSLYAWGMALLPDNPETAGKLLREAAAIFEEVGVTSEFEKARAALERIG